MPVTRAGKQIRSAGLSLCDGVGIVSDELSRAGVEQILSPFGFANDGERITDGHFAKGRFPSLCPRFDVEVDDKGTEVVILHEEDAVLEVDW